MTHLVLDGPTLAQIDALARRLGIVEVGEARAAKRRAEVVRRLLLCWETHHPARTVESLRVQ